MEQVYVKFNSVDQVNQFVNLIDRFDVNFNMGSGKKSDLFCFQRTQVKMPMAGIGTFLLSPDEAETSVTNALQASCRLIDAGESLFFLRKCVRRW